MSESEYRVIREWSAGGEEFTYFIGVPNPQLNYHPLTHYFTPGSSNRLSNRLTYKYIPEFNSVEKLKSELKAMLAACDKPVLELEIPKLSPILKEFR